MAQVELLPEVRKLLEESSPKMVIGGRRVTADSGETLQVVDPSTGEALTEVPRAGVADVDDAVAAAKEAFEDRRWSSLRPGKRTEVLFELSRLIDEHAGELAQIESLDSGKPIKLAAREIWKASEVFRYYAGWPTKVYGETNPSEDDLFVYSLREPVGVCGAIIPWNFPLLMAAFKLAPVLAFGNTLVLKPAEQTPLTALKLAELCHSAGVPEGVVNVITGFGNEAGQALARHGDVDKISFTGSTEVGRRILHGAEGNLKRVTLELGGKSPNIVLEDADLSRASECSMRGVFVNSGQVCSAGTRILVERPVHDEFVSSLVDATSSMRLGPPLSEDTGMGPVVSEEQLRRVTGYIEMGRLEGAQVATGGEVASGLGDGFFVQPTVFTGVRNDMQIAQEEIFGPVVAVIEVSDVEEAVATANDSIYGLAASVWTTNLTKAHRIARGIRAGTVWVNTIGLYDPSVSYGGYKQSGFGRDLGLHSMDEYTETKSVWVDLR